MKTNKSVILWQYLIGFTFDDFIELKILNSIKT